MKPAEKTELSIDQKLQLVQAAAARLRDKMEGGPVVDIWDGLCSSPEFTCPAIPMDALRVTKAPEWLRREVRRQVELGTPLHAVVALGLMQRLLPPGNDNADDTVLKACLAVPRETLEDVLTRALVLLMSQLATFDALERDDLECVWTVAFLNKVPGEPMFRRVLLAVDEHVKKNVEEDFVPTAASAYSTKIEGDGAERLDEVHLCEPNSWWSSQKYWA